MATRGFQVTRLACGRHDENRNGDEETTLLVQHYGWPGIPKQQTKPLHHYSGGFPFKFSHWDSKFT